MQLCIATGAGIIKIATLAFTLSWTHSAQKSRWEEDWSIGHAGLTILDARIESTGAGMEMGEDARFDGRFWHWRPALGALKTLQLRRSDAVPEGYTLCAAGACRPIADKDEAADIVTLSPCE